MLAAPVDDWSARNAAAKVTLRHTTALLALDPQAPVAAFLHAEARVAAMGAGPDALQSMRHAVQVRSTQSQALQLPVCNARARV